MYQGGDTPLLVAASAGHLSVVEYLVEKGAEIEVTDFVRIRMCVNDLCAHLNVSVWKRTVDKCRHIRIFASG